MTNPFFQIFENFDGEWKMKKEETMLNLSKIRGLELIPR